METKDKISEHDGFMIINEMIQTAKHAVVDNSFHYLLWGWVVFTASILNYILLTVVQTSYNWLPWPILTGLGGLAAMIYNIREKNNQKVQTYFNRFLGYTWMAVIISLFLTIFIGSKFGVTAVYPMIMILYGLGLYISGKTLEFMPLVIGSLGCWGCAVIACFVPFDVQLIILGLSVLFGYIIPGYILKLKFRHENAQ